MTKLPSISGRKLIKALAKDGWVIKSQKGSHVKLIKPGVKFPLLIPVHGKASIPKGTLASILKDAGISVEKLNSLLKQ